MTLRVSQHSLSFSVIDNSTESQLVFKSYTFESGIPLAANLRKVFEGSDLFSYGYQRAQVMVDSLVLMIPIDEFDEGTIEILYHHAFIGHGDSTVLYAIPPDLNAVAMFSMSEDPKLVITDHSNDVCFHLMLQPAWSYPHKRSFTGAYQRLYVYFHDKEVDVFCFQHNRFRFRNTFNAVNTQDAIYFLLYAWKLLAPDTEKDELHIAGDVSECKWSTDNLHRRLQKMYYINPTVEFNHAPITNIKGIASNPITFFLKGR